MRTHLLILVIIFSFFVVPVNLFGQSTQESYKEISKRIGHFTAEDWATAIDTTWGEGLPTADKLKIFDLFWETIDEDYAGFHNLDVNWDSLRIVYRPEIEAGVSRGRFSGIMDRLVMALMEFHTHIYDSEVRGDSLKPGIPLLAYHSAYNGFDNGHFGAGLTPLPDSSALVYKVVENHPLGLENGDIILGYDGIPWKYLYQDLLAAELPITHPGENTGVGSSERAVSHIWLMSAGLNWHLFDMIDILKVGSNDTLHLPTSTLIDQEMHLFCSEQLPVPGVPMVDLSNWDENNMVSWGMVDGSQIGYIYVSRWRYSGGDDIAFLKAINSIIANNQIRGLILDFRTNPGGQMGTANEGFSRLFNFDLSVLEFAERSNPDDHFAMKSIPSGYCSGENWRFEADAYLFDKPIAVLTGPLTVSAADYNSLRLKYHPMSRFFGKSTNSGFTCFEVTFHNLSIPFPGWLSGYAARNVFSSDNPEKFFMHNSFDVDEEIWLTQADVAKGEDTVVKRAVEWIQNLAYAHDVSVNNTFIANNEDSVCVSAIVENPNSHELKVMAYLNQNDILVDSIQLSNTPSVIDCTWTGYWQVPDEKKSYHVNVKTRDMIDRTERTISNVQKFTRIGPVVLKDYRIGLFEQNLMVIKITLENLDTSATAFNVIAKVFSDDSCVTDIPDSIDSFGNLTPGSSRECSGIYSLNIDPKCADNNLGSINLSVNIFSNGDLFWTDSTDIPTNLKQIDQNIPKSYSLSQNYPNPFNPSTSINFALPKSEFVSLKIYNILGEEIASLVNNKLQAGNHSYQFDGSNLASGVYLYRIEAGEFQDVKKMILIK